jgi:uncharacterized protein YraI
MTRPADATPPASTAAWGRVRVANVNVRWGPGPKHGIITVLRGGDFVRILERKEGWYRIEWPRSAPAWVCSDFVTADGRVTGNRVRIRAGGTPASPILGHVNKKDRVEILDSVGNWYKIKPPMGAEAYIYAKLVIAGVAPPEDIASVQPEEPAETNTQPKTPEEPTKLEPADAQQVPTEESTSQPGPELAANTQPETEQAAAAPATADEPAEATETAPLAPPEQPQTPVAEEPEEPVTPAAPPAPVQSAAPTQIPEQVAAQPEPETPSVEPESTHTAIAQEPTEEAAPTESVSPAPEVSAAQPAPEEPLPDTTHTLAAQPQPQTDKQPTVEAKTPETAANANRAPQITFARAGPSVSVPMPVPEPEPAPTAAPSTLQPSKTPRQPNRPMLPAPEDLEDEDPKLEVHTPDQAAGKPDRASRLAMETLVEVVPSASKIQPTSIEPHLIVVPVEVRAAADRDEFGELLPPPSFVRERIAPKEVPHAPSTPPSLLTTADRLRASAPLIFRLPGRANLAEEFVFLTGKLQAAPETDSGYRHHLTNGSTTLLVRSDDPQLNLDLFVGRHVEVLVRCASTPRELQVAALHPID